MFDIQEELKKLLGKPGVYLMHDEKDEIIYVAKKAMANGKMEMLYSVPNSDPWYDWIGEYSILAEPFMIKDTAVGCLLVWVKKSIAK